MGLQESNQEISGVAIVAKDELARLYALERRIRAVLSYYSDLDLAAHLAAASDGGPIYSDEGVVRKVWVNHKLAGMFRELKEEMGIA